MTIPYSEPELGKKAFNCPFCNAYAFFDWSDVVADGYVTNYNTAQCAHCRARTLWKKGDKGDLIYPLKLTSPLAHKDFPKSCKSEYEEARSVFPFSVRAAAALLRLCIQKLCKEKEFGGKGKNIDEDIGKLVKKGLDERIQKALDIVRVTGNNAVHPGVMDVKDDKALVNKLFKLVNMIVEEMITKPNEINTLYGKLPEKSKKAIKKRDS